MIKPRAKITRSVTPERAIISPLGEPEIKISAWCPDSEAKEPPEQVHIIYTVPGLEEYPLIQRFKSPDTLGFLIEELAAYRCEVWPDSQPVEL